MNNNPKKQRRPLRVKGMTLRGIVILLFFLAAAALLVFSHIARAREVIAAGEEPVDIRSILYGFFLAGFLITAGFKGMELANRQDNKQAELISSIPDEEFELIMSQLTPDRFFYGTYYLTDTALYVPKRKLLFTYNRIKFAFVHIHRGKGFHRWHIHIVDKSNCNYNFNVKQYSEFVRNKDAVMYQLNSKCGGDARYEQTVSQLTDDRFYYKTYYLTDTGLYVPHKGLLLDYDQMQSVYAHSHSLRGIPRWHIHITDKEGCDYYFDVKQYFKFVRNVDAAVYHIRSMFDESAKEHIEKFDDTKG
ncbi:MAG: hypothetical protein J1E40_01770 [Oscillospiraceae bacterium]|nr:hypothetical protein [Oscillospiraceae bacterium]